MSAFLLPCSHIDALVTVTLRGPADFDRRRRTWHPISYRLPDSNPSQERRWADHDQGDELGRMLWRENAVSVGALYEDLGPEDLPGYALSADVVTYSWPFRGRQLTALEGLKALDCYEYQSCEHPGWQDSEARRFSDQLRRALVDALPGYAAAAWVVEAQP